MNNNFATETVRAPGKGFTAGIGYAIITLIVGIFFPPLLVVGGLCLIGAPILGLFTRIGPCPNCGKELYMALKSARCPTCKHVVVLRGTQMVDVS